MNEIDPFSCIIPPLKSKSILKDKEIAVISSKCRHLIWQNIESHHDKRKFSACAAIIVS